MSRKQLLTRRQFVTSVSALALTTLFLPKTAPAPNDEEFIVVNGWVLKRSETA